MTDPRGSRWRVLTVLFASCLFVSSAGVIAAYAGSGDLATQTGVIVPGDEPSSPGPQTSVPGPQTSAPGSQTSAPDPRTSPPSPETPTPGTPTPTPSTQDSPTAEACASATPSPLLVNAGMLVRKAPKNKGPYKIDVKTAKDFSRKDLGVSECALYTNCTIEGVVVSGCTIGGLGRYIEVKCGAVKGKDVIEVTVEEGNTITKFKVDIQCV